MGRDRISEPVLKWCLDRGLREIEKRDNFYWMEASQTFDILDSQQEYSLTDDLLITDFKEAEIMLVSDRTETDPIWTEVVGPEPIANTKSNFSETADGKPNFWTLNEDNDDPTIMFWPPVPDQDYRGQLIYYKWTNLPDSSTSEAHEVLKRWPEALIYLAMEQAIMVSTKDMEAASYWRSMFVNINPVVNTEYKRIKLYQESRHSAQRFRNSATNGTTTLSAKLNSAQKQWF